MLSGSKKGRLEGAALRLTRISAETHGAKLRKTNDNLYHDSEGKLPPEIRSSSLYPLGLPLLTLPNSGARGPPYLPTCKGEELLSRGQGQVASEGWITLTSSQADHVYSRHFKAGQLIALQINQMIGHVHHPKTIAYGVRQLICS